MISEVMRKRNNYQRLVKVGYRKNEAVNIRAWKNEKVDLLVKDAEKLGKDRVIVLLKEFEARINEMLVFWCNELPDEVKNNYIEKYLPEKFNVHIEGHLNHIQDLEKVVELQKKEYENIKSLKVEREKEEAESKKLEKKLKQLQKEYDETLQELEEEQDKNVELKRQVKDLNIKLEEVESMIEEKIREYKEANEGWEEAYNKLETDYNDLLQEHEELKENFDFLVSKEKKREQQRIRQQRYRERQKKKKEEVLNNG